MSSQSHQSGHGSFFTRERRFIGQTGVVTPEAPRERPSDVSENTRVFLEHLSLEIQRRELRGTEKTEFYRARVTTLTRDQLEELDTWIRGGVDLPEVFQQVFRRDTPEHQEVLDITKQQLDALKTSIGGVVKSGFEASMGYAEKVTDFVLPERLTESMTPTQRRVFGTAATLGTAVLVGWVAHAIFRGRKAAGEKKGGWLKKAFWGLLIGGIAIVGGSYLVDQIVRKRAKEAAEEVAQRGRESVAQTEKRLQQQVKDIQKQMAASADGTEKSELQRKSEELKARLNQLQRNRTLGILSDKAQSQLHGAVATGLLLLNNKRANEAGVKNSRVAREKVRDILQREDVRRIPLGKLTKMTGPNDIQHLALDGDLQPEQRRALFFLSLVVRDLVNNVSVRGSLARKGIGEDQMSELSLEVFLRSSSRVSSLFGRLSDALEGSNLRTIDVRGVFDKLFASEEAAAELASDHVLAGRLTELEPELRQGRKLELFVAYCYAKKDRTLMDVVRELSDESGDAYLDAEERTLFARALQRMQSELVSQGSVKYLLQYAHEPQYEELVREYLNQDLNVFDALQLLTYLELNRDASGQLPKDLQSSDPMGAFLLQMKVLNVVARKGRNNEGMHLRDKLLFMDKDLMLPEGTAELLVRVGKTFGKRILESMFGPLGHLADEAWSKVYHAHTEQTVRTVGAEAMVGGGIGALIYRYLQKPMSKKMDAWIRTRELRMAKGNIIVQSVRQAVRGRAAEKFFERAPDLRADIWRMYDHINNMGSSGENLGRGFEKFLSRGFHKKSFEQFAKDIRDARRAAELAGERGVVAAFDDALGVLRTMANRARQYQLARFSLPRRVVRALTFRWAHSGKAIDALEPVHEGQATTTPRRNAARGPAPNLDGAEEIVTGAERRFDVVDVDGDVRPAGAPRVAEAMEEAGERIDDLVPPSVERIIAESTESAADATKMRRGFSVLKKITAATPAALDGLFLVYEGWQLAALWRDVAELEEKYGSADTFLARAVQEKKEIVWFRGRDFLVDAGATAASAGSFLIGGKALVLVTHPAGWIALVGLPVVAAVDTGIRESISRKNIHGQMGLWERIEGIDEEFLGQSPFEQLYELGDPYVSQGLGALLTSVTLEDMEKHNRADRERIVLSMVLRQLKDLRPEKFQKLLAKIRVAMDIAGSKHKKDIENFHNRPIARNLLLPFLRDAFVEAARVRLKKSRPSVTPASLPESVAGAGVSRSRELSNHDMTRLRTFDIDADWLRTRLNEEDIRNIVYDAAQVLEAWVDREDGGISSVEKAKCDIARLRTEKLNTAQERMRDAFGAHADRLMRMPLKELAEVRQRHANTFVDLQYYDHSVLWYLREDRERLQRQGHHFVVNLDKDLPLLRHRLDALNEYLQVRFRVPKIVLREDQPLPATGPARVRVSPSEAFLRAGDYRVQDNDVTHAYDLDFPKRTPRHLDEQSRWLQGARRRYNALFEEFGGAYEERKAA